MSYEWKNKPIEQALKGMKCIPHLKAAGFNTAGDIIDSTPEEIADRAHYIGMKRAHSIRDLVLSNALDDALANKFPVEWREVDVVNEPLPLSFQIALFISLGLSLASFCGLLLEVTK